MLHIISNVESGLVRQCKDTFSDSDHVVFLIDDRQNQSFLDEVIDTISRQTKHLYGVFCRPENKVSTKLHASLSTISYKEFVLLSIQHHPIHTWY